MPLYTYQCEHCQTVFDVRASFQEKERGIKPQCPNCSNPDTHQVLTAGLLIGNAGSGGGSQSSSCCGSNSGSGCCG